MIFFKFLVQSLNLITFRGIFFCLLSHLTLTYELFKQKRKKETYFKGLTSVESTHKRQLRKELILTCSFRHFVTMCCTNTSFVTISLVESM